MRAHTKVLLRDHRGPLSWVLGWHVVAALVALVGPWVIGQVVQEVTTGDGEPDAASTSSSACSSRRSSSRPC